MIPSALRSTWATHPWLAGFEGLLALVAALEVVLVAHVLLGWLIGLVGHNPEAFRQVRLVFLTGADAAFGATLVALAGLLPLGLLLALVGGAGWTHAHLSGAATPVFSQATFGGLGAAAFAVGWVVVNARLLGGGIIPR
jgi:hypothetical protein